MCQAAINNSCKASDYLPRCGFPPGRVGSITLGSACLLVHRHTRSPSRQSNVHRLQPSFCQQLQTGAPGSQTDTVHMAYIGILFVPFQVLPIYEGLYTFFEVLGSDGELELDQQLLDQQLVAECLASLHDSHYSCINLQQHQADLSQCNIRPAQMTRLWFVLAFGWSQLLLLRPDVAIWSFQLLWSLRLLPAAMLNVSCQNTMIKNDFQ